MGGKLFQISWSYSDNRSDLRIGLLRKREIPLICGGARDLSKLKILRMIHLSWEQSRWNNHLLIVGIEVWIPGQIVAHAQCWERSDAMMAEPDQHWPGEHKVLRSWQYVNADQQPANPSTAFDCSSPLRLYDPRKLWNMSGENGRGN